jgi:uncharacterized protein involved in outer membrane biogenesis
MLRQLRAANFPSRGTAIPFRGVARPCILALAMPLRRNTVLIVAGIAVLLVAALILVLPALVRVDRYRPEVISYLHEKLGKEVEIGRLSLTLFPVSIHVDDFGVKNPPIFPPGYVVKIAHVDAALDVRALLHRRVIIKSIVLDNPVLHLTSDPDGPWNFENPQAKASQGTFPLGVISKVEIQRGEIVASNLLPSDAQGPIFFEAHEISCELEDVNLIGIISAASSSVDGQGSLKAGRLSFGTVEARNLNSRLQLASRQVFFTDVKAQVYDGSAAGAFSFDLSGKNASFKTNAKFGGISVAHLLAPYQSGRGKMTGKMEGDVTLAGQIEHTPRPLAGLRGSGHVTLRNGEVPSLQLNANLMKLVRFNDLGPAKENPASFNMISTDLELAHLRITSKKIDIDGYGVDVDGSGNVNVDGSGDLNYDGVAQITTPQGFLTRTFARFAGATVKDGKLSFPFHIGGTIANPLFAKVERVQ